MLSWRERQLRQQGMGKRPYKADSIDQHEEEILWQHGQLGLKTPSAFINTIWQQMTQHFVLRGRQEHHTLKIEDLTFKINEQGTTYPIYAKGITKTRQYGPHENHRLYQKCLKQSLIDIQFRYSSSIFPSAQSNCKNLVLFI